MLHVPEQYRIKTGQMMSDASYGNNGAFFINRGRTSFFAIASDGMNWEHVSIHAITDNKERTPTWSEMCFIKSLFWEENDVVIQYHPAKIDYVNMHKHTLHLWRPINVTLPVPDKLMV